MKLVMNLCEKLFVLDYGHLIATHPKSLNNMWSKHTWRCSMILSVKNLTVLRRQALKGIASLYRRAKHLHIAGIGTVRERRTTLKAISGLLPKTGDVIFRDKDITTTLAIP